MRRIVSRRQRPGFNAARNDEHTPSDAAATDYVAQRHRHFARAGRGNVLPGDVPSGGRPLRLSQ
jgi:hypothetical protein